MDRLRDGRIGEYLTALKRNPDDQGIYVRLAQIYLELFGRSQKMKDWEAAVDYFREGENRGAFSGLGYVVQAADLSRQGRHEEVGGVYERGLKRFLDCVEANPFGREEYVKSLGVLYILLKQEEEIGGQAFPLLSRIPEKLLHMLEEMRSKSLDPWFVSKEGSVKEERRRYVRVKSGSEIKGKLKTPGVPAEQAVRVLDVAEKGLLVSGEKGLDQGVKVTLTLQWPGLDQPLQVEGLVKWMKAEGQGGTFGIEIPKAPEDTRKILWAYVRRRLEEEGRGRSSGAA